MVITAKQLADGQLGATEAAIYTVPASTTAYVRVIICQNTGGGNNTVQLWMRPSGGTSRRIVYVTLKANETFVFDDPLALDAGDSIRGAATNAAQVDFSVYGAEET